MTSKRPSAPSERREQLNLFDAPAPTKTVESMASVESPVSNATSAPPETSRASASSAFVATPQDIPPDVSVVPRQTSGIPYQHRYAALRGLNLSVDEYLGVEQWDDVSISGPNGITLIQVKDEMAALTDLNKGFWKALAHWARRLKASLPHDNQFRQFIFATTAKITGNLARAFSNSTMPMREDYIERHLAELFSDDDEVASAIAEVRALDKDLRRDLIRKVIIQEEADADGLRAKIKQKLLSLTFHADTIETATREYEGWFENEILTAISKKKGAVVRAREIFSVLRNMRDRLRNRKLQFNHRKTPIGDDIRAAQRTRLFFRQLKAINVSVEQRNMALEDFLRDKLEREEWTQHLSVLRDDLNNFDSDLFEIWRHEFNSASPNGTIDEEENGRELYNDLMDYRRSPKLAGDAPPPHVYRGSYHRLADFPPQIGWHPRWETLFGAQVINPAGQDPDSGPSDE